MEQVRLDKYLWAIRVFKTRTLSTAAIDGGKVKCNGASVKPAHKVAIGDRYTIKTPARNWIIEVTGLILNRAAYSEAIKHYIDLTPEEEKLLPKHMGSAFNTGKRQSKTGHPTKKQRRDLDDFLTEDTDQE